MLGTSDEFNPLKLDNSLRTIPSPDKVAARNQLYLKIRRFLVADAPLVRAPSSERGLRVACRFLHSLLANCGTEGRCIPDPTRLPEGHGPTGAGCAPGMGMRSTRSGSGSRSRRQGANPYEHRARPSLRSNWAWGYGLVSSGMRAETASGSRFTSYKRTAGLGDPEQSGPSFYLTDITHSTTDYGGWSDHFISNSGSRRRRSAADPEKLRYREVEGSLRAVGRRVARWCEPLLLRAIGHVPPAECEEAYQTRLEAQPEPAGLNSPSLR